MHSDIFWVDENNLTSTNGFKTMIGRGGGTSGGPVGTWYTLNGTSWTQATSEPPGNTVLEAILPDGTLIAVSDPGWGASTFGPQYSRSTDGGATWATRTTFPDMLGGINAYSGTYRGCTISGDIARDSRGYLYVSGHYTHLQVGDASSPQAIVWRSTDGGVSWATVYNDTSPVVGSPYMSALSYKRTKNGDVFLFGVSTLFSTAIGFYLQRSTDGATWTRALTGPNDGTELAIPNVALRIRNNPGWASNGDWLCFAQAVVVPINVRARLYRSTDDGVTWGEDNASLFETTVPNWTICWGDNGAASSGVDIVTCSQATGGGVGVTWGASSAGGVESTWRSTDGGHTWTPDSSFGGTRPQIPFLMRLGPILAGKVSLPVLRDDKEATAFVASMCGIGRSLFSEIGTHRENQLRYIMALDNMRKAIDRDRRARGA